MGINNILESLNDLFKYIENNKLPLVLVLILLGIYFTSIANSKIVKNSIYLFDNDKFKFAIFMIIIYVSNSSPAIGIALALIIFVSFQIITHVKLKKELDDDIFSIIE